MSYLEGVLKGIKPLPDITVSEWADKYRFLTTKSSAEPGQWRTSRTPYLKEIMDVMSPKAKTRNGNPATKIVFIKGAQLGGSEALINCVGYYVDIAPCPILYVLSTVDLAKFTSTDRIDPLIEMTPSIRAKIGEKRSHNAENAILKKGFSGGSLRFIGANSPVGLRSAAVRLLVLDEVSSYPDATPEGDPVELALKRADTFGENKKVLAVSTPTIENQCKITRMFEETDQRYFHIPCPHCNFYQVLQFKNFRWESGIPSSVYYECESCKGKIHDEIHKKTMIQKGKWIPKFPERDVIGFHLSSLYSPNGWKSWKQVIDEYEKAQGKPDLERVFCNTVLGLPYRMQGDSIDWEYLFNNRREKYQRNVIPRRAAGGILVCGADVQQDRIELEIILYYKNFESWSLDYRTIPGDTSQDEVWKEFTKVVNESFPIEGTSLTRKIQMTCVDTGFNATNVYYQCRRFSSSQVMPVKSFSSLPMIHAAPKTIEFSYKGKKISRGVKLMNIGCDVIKQEIFSFLKQDKIEDSNKGVVYPQGYFHFPWEYSQDYFKMLTAEEYVRTKDKKGREKYEFVQIRHRNESLDCRVMARAASSLIGLDRYKDSDFDKVERQILIPEETKVSMEKRRRLEDEQEENEIYGRMW